MNFRVFSSEKISLVSVIVITLIIILVCLIRQKDTGFQMSQNKGLKDLQLNKIDTLLSATEQAALIKQIVKESLKEIMLAKEKIQIETQTKAKESEPVKTFDQTLNPLLFQRLFHKGVEIGGNHSIRNSKFEAFQIQVTLDEREMMYRLLEIFDKVMKKNNITYFMYSGTLLGSFRHHDIIPWDDDIDVILSVEHHERMVTVFQPLLPEYILYRAGGHDKFYHKSAKKASAYKWLWPYVDISYYEENSTYIKDWVQTYGAWNYFPKEIVFPLHDRPLFNLSLPAPKDTFAFLAWSYQYGSNCVMFGYSHMVEGRGPSGRINCTTLADKFPFVDHLPDKNGVREILKYKDLEIQNIVVKEPVYAVAETFKLSLKSGFRMPTNITPPVT